MALRQADVDRDGCLGNEDFVRLENLVGVVLSRDEMNELTKHLMPLGLDRSTTSSCGWVDKDRFFRFCHNRKEEIARSNIVQGSRCHARKEPCAKEYLSRFTSEETAR